MTAGKAPNANYRPARAKKSAGNAKDIFLAALEEEQILGKSTAKRFHASVKKAITMKPNRVFITQVLPLRTLLIRFTPLLAPMTLVVVLLTASMARAAITFIEVGDSFISNIGTPMTVPAPPPLPPVVGDNGPEAHAAVLLLPFADVSVYTSGAWWFPESEGAGINTATFFGPGSPIGYSPGPHVLFVSDITEPDTIAQIKAAYNSLPADHLVNILGDGVAHQVFLADVVPEPSMFLLLIVGAAALAFVRRRSWVVRLLCPRRFHSR